MCEIIPIGREQIYDVYINSFNDPQRHGRMIRRFEEVGVEAKLYNYIANDPRCYEILEYNKKDPRTIHYGNFYSMLRIIEDFYNHSTKEYCVIFENDVFLKKSLAYDLPKACKMLTKLNLDVLLIGCLLTCTPEQMGYQRIYRDEDLNDYFSYDDNLWGGHGFIIHRKHAKWLMDTLTFEYASKLEGVGSDWIYSKICPGNRALRWVPLVVEEGFVKAEDQGQRNYHMQCRNFQYNTSYTI